VTFAGPYIIMPHIFRSHTAQEAHMLLSAGTDHLVTPRGDQRRGNTVHRFNARCQVYVRKPFAKTFHAQKIWVNYLFFEFKDFAYHIPYSKNWPN
jgi:hypothetical protein